MCGLVADAGIAQFRRRIRKSLADPPDSRDHKGAEALQCATIFTKGQTHLRQG
jgi:hypothetical protein